MKRLQSLCANDSRHTDWVVVCVGLDGTVAVTSAQSWQKACNMADVAIKSNLVIAAYARNEETGEEYRP